MKRCLPSTRTKATWYAKPSCIVSAPAAERIGLVILVLGVLFQIAFRLD